MDNRYRPDSKKRLVQCAHTVLVRDGVAEFSMRRVAAECGCGVSSLYRHFSGRDELLLHAQVWFITDYLREVADSWDANTLAHYFRIERSFAKYSFQQPALFYSIYFGPLSGKMDQILRQHLALFPESYGFVTEEMRTMFAQEDGLSRRNLEALLRCREEGFFAADPQTLACLNDIVIHMYRGYLEEAMVHQQQGQDTDGMAEQYLTAHWTLHRQYLAPEWREHSYQEILK